jgi:hypothetical protein
LSSAAKYYSRYILELQACRRHHVPCLEWNWQRLQPFQKLLLKAHSIAKRQWYFGYGGPKRAPSNLIHYVPESSNGAKDSARIFYS